MRKYIIPFLFTIVLIGQIFPYPKKSLVERYTNSGCPPCKETNDNWYTATTQSLINSNTISHIIYNVSWPDPQDPMYLFNTTDNSTRWNYYSVNSVPWMTVNGSTITLSNTSSSYLLNAVSAGNSNSSPFKIVLTSFLSPTNLLDVHVKILRDPSDSNIYSNTKLRIALTEREIYFPTYPGSASNGEKTFYSITRKMLPDANGTLFNPPAPGDSTEQDILFTCSPSFMQTVIMDSVRIVAFLQDDNSKFIYQSEMTNLSKTPQFFAYSSVLNMGDVEISNSSDSIKDVFYNSNTHPCVISNITSQSGPFKLLENLSYPLTVAVNDSLILHFNFTPSQTGNFTEYFSFTSNDSIFKGITLQGLGYKIIAASDNSLYASSGSSDSGKVIIINPQTGSGTALSPSLYSEIRSIAVHPKTKIVYGISSNSINSGILRINAPGGDAYNYFTLPLADMGAITFDTAGTLYAGMHSGVIYQINLQTKEFTRICSLKVKIQSLAFNPVTNELWGTPYVVLGSTKDRIYKVNLSTGDTMVVGQTGFGMVTNAIAFDNSGNLYGVTGASTVVNNLISLNKQTAQGTLIGSTGYQNITGISFSPVVTGINDKPSIPVIFSMMQNYPNPFNPSTTIRYSIPNDGIVNLAVYNTLGQKVGSLVNQYMQAGNYEVKFDGSRMASGIYFYRLEVGNFQSVKKMILMK